MTSLAPHTTLKSIAWGELIFDERAATPPCVQSLIWKHSTLNPAHSTLTLNPQPSALHHHPSTLNPQPSTLNPQPSTLAGFFLYTYNEFAFKVLGLVSPVAQVSHPRLFDKHSGEAVGAIDYVSGTGN